MAIKPVNLVPGVGAQLYYAPSSTAFTAGQLLYRGTSTNYVIPFTSTLGDTTNVECITTVAETTGSGTAYIKAIPVTSGLFVIADCTNNTDYNQLNIAHAFTDSKTVNNTSTHSTAKTSVFIALRIVGALSDKKLYGYIAKSGQVTA